MKIKIGKISVILFIISVLLVTSICCKKKEKFVKGEFSVAIASGYKSTFLEKGFTAKDFNIDEEYIEYIHYTPWFSNGEVGYIFIQLKQPYWKKLDKIMKSVSELDFVTRVEKVPIYYLC